MQKLTITFAPLYALVTLIQMTGTALEDKSTPRMEEMKISKTAHKLSEQLLQQFGNPTGKLT